MNCSYLKPRIRTSLETVVTGKSVLVLILTMHYNTKFEYVESMNDLTVRRAQTILSGLNGNSRCLVLFWPQDSNQSQIIDYFQIQKVIYKGLYFQCTVLA